MITLSLPRLLLIPAPCMFGNHAFQSWAVILIGGVVFAMLFMIAAMMTEVLFDGAFEMTPGAMAFGLAAFVAYVGAAIVLRHDDRSGSS